MATDTAKQVWPGESRVQFYASWETYQIVARAIGDQQVRIAFDGERLELMSPSPGHEFLKHLAECLVATLAGELGMPRSGMGAARWERPEASRGLEADAAFYLSSEKIAILSRRPKTASEYPIPDLAIEIEPEHASKLGPQGRRSTRRSAFPRCGGSMARPCASTGSGRTGPPTMPARADPSRYVLTNSPSFSQLTPAKRASLPVK